MKKITQITKRDIIDIINNGIVINTDNIINPDYYENNLEDKNCKICYHGRLNEFEFLQRIYDLQNMTSTDSRYSNAEGDIQQHTINNDDWDIDWVFSDKRFGLLYGDDEIFLKFICEMFHPIVRNESQPWKKILSIINDLLRIDGYELYELRHISGRAIYTWREIGEDIIVIPENTDSKTYELKLIGEGSYAKVFKYKNNTYQKFIVLKRAKTDLNEKELERFKREYDQMKSLNSPYIVEVYGYDQNKHEYSMEYMDFTLEKYISTNNGNLTFKQRKGISMQILRAFKYLHSKGLLHRDVCPKNILVKKYDDVDVFKVSDFGLVKIPESNLTSLNTEYKGYFNDPELRLEGFSSYGIVHEIYALTRVIYFVMTGKTNTDKILNESLKNFVIKGLNPDKKLRYQNIEQLTKAFSDVIE